jgi:uncharacterized protein with NRDE domain
MCTLIVATRVWQSTPLVVAANRDERLGRPAKGPALVVQGGVRFFAPRDLQAGGTWIGVNAHGVFVAITNRFTGRAAARAGRSRGLLVLDALAEDSAAHAVRRIAAEAPSRHDPFHLVMADAAEAHLVWSDGEIVRHERLAPGFHVVTERSLGAAPSPRAERLHVELRELYGPKQPSPERWMAILRTHAQEGLEGTCVHLPSHGYGTRSSTIVEVASAQGGVRWWHADGPPCTTDYADLSEDLRPLLG